MDRKEFFVKPWKGIIEAAMNHFTRVFLFLFLLNAGTIAGLSQLRNLSDYTENRINIEKTYFLIHDDASVEFGWASEWTHAVSNGVPEKAAFFLWHFKNGVKAYSLVLEQLGDAGMKTGYLLTGKASNLEDVRRKSIQPMTRENYPVRLELWVGTLTESDGYTLENMVDAACFETQAIESNRSYHFTHCE
jgi:hypothetical protein